MSAIPTTDLDKAAVIVQLQKEILWPKIVIVLMIVIFFLFLFWLVRKIFSRGK